LEIPGDTLAGSYVECILDQDQKGMLSASGGLPPGTGVDDDIKIEIFSWLARQAANQRIRQVVEQTITTRWTIQRC
jgi:hypothetical protein